MWLVFDLIALGGRLLALGWVLLALTQASLALIGCFLTLKTICLQVGSFAPPNF